MPSFLVSREWDNRNRWCDGQVCPDVGQELWRLGRDGEQEPCPGWKIRKSPALDRENWRGEPCLERTEGEPWLERT
ncbi:hypothetical protein TNCV_4950731 [Trichonephila clavipes]|nr:hypothetical protein TNCV_4950731 [Trichonephila clavipes]